MGRLIKFEFRKLLRQKSFYICFGISAVILLLNLLIFGTDEYYAQQLSVVSLTQSTLSDSSFILLSGIFIALYVCGDYSNGTFKNIYSHGYSRTEVYFSKYIVSLIAELVAAVFFFIFSAALGSIFAGAKEAADGGFFVDLLCQLIMVAGYHAVYFSLAFMIGRTGGSVAVNIVGPTLVFTILALVSDLLQLDVTLSDYWLDTPFAALAQGSPSTKTVVKAIVMSLAYGAVFVCGGYFIGRRKEF